MTIIETTALITINETLIVVVISFLVFLAIINRIMFRPLNRAMDERQTHLEGMKQEIGRTKQEVLDLVAQLTDRETDVKHHARRLNEETLKAGQAEAATLIADARKEIVKRRKESERQVAVDLAKARQELRVESEAVAMAILEKIIERRPA
ncbi:MAG: ATP synthase F0 subunit B [Desulfobacterales bacterium]|nr:ATP synthase F0 subunit B [Desulfobacterales bacterium]